MKLHRGSYSVSAIVDIIIISVKKITFLPRPVWYFKMLLMDMDETFSDGLRAARTRKNLSIIANQEFLTFLVRFRLRYWIRWRECIFPVSICATMSWKPINFRILLTSLISHRLPVRRSPSQSGSFHRLGWIDSAGSAAGRAWMARIMADNIYTYGRTQWMLRRPQDDYYRRDVGAHSWQLCPADLNLLQLKVQQGTSIGDNGFIRRGSWWLTRLLYIFYREKKVPTFYVHSYCTNKTTPISKPTICANYHTFTFLTVEISDIIK